MTSRAPSRGGPAHDRTRRAPRAAAISRSRRSTTWCRCSVLGAATRLGYDDGRVGTAARTGNAIAYALGLASWTGLQRLQLRQAYVTGRQHGVSERRICASRSAQANERPARMVAGPQPKQRRA